ncbi:MAG: hypothetical protein SGPRY_006149, partial [Prymnesium sp.]
PPLPTCWLLKNTDTFAGFAHAVGTYLAGISIAHSKQCGLLYRPQPMAHSLGYTFDDFFSLDPRGHVPPLFSPTLAESEDAMLVDGRPVKLDVIAGGAAVNASKLARRIGVPHSLVWLRKGRSSLPVDCTQCHTHSEVRYAGLWLREMFWRAATVWEASAESRRGGEMSKGRGGGGEEKETRGFVARPLRSGVGVTRVAVHVRRGDVFYLGPKTGRPHPHWVDSQTSAEAASQVLDILRGVSETVGPLLLPAVELDLFTEKGWLHNDTKALRMLAPAARVHMASDPHSTVDALIAMSRADLLVGMPMYEKLPLRHVEYASTITTRNGSFEASIDSLRREWEAYSACKGEATCRPSLCNPSRITSHHWLRGLGREAAADHSAIQWRLPELFWTELPRASSRLHTTSSLRQVTYRVNRHSPCPSPVYQDSSQAEGGLCSPAIKGMWRRCLELRRSEESLAYAQLWSCVRGLWHANLTAFLKARKRLPGYPGYVEPRKSSLSELHKASKPAGT